jgi:ATP-dependent Clp protease ATP-binding subunit ClpC
MFERYSEVAKRVLFFARWEVSRHGGSSILPEHLLLGLARERAGIAASLLSGAGLTHDAVRARVTFPETATTDETEEIPFSEATKRALFAAESEADQMSSTAITSGHLLLALLRDDSSPVFQALHESGVRLREARDGVQSAIVRGDSDSGPYEGPMDGFI